MKIIKVVVDELPKSALMCEWAILKITNYEHIDEIRCQLTRRAVSVMDYETTSKRCPNCPLVEEAEEVQE